MQRKSGVLMHISSLYGDYSCGSFGKPAKHFIDVIAQCGLSYWQTLPFCMTDEYNSPYKSHSTFAGNLNFIDLEVLFEKSLLTKEELEENKQSYPYLCEFSKLKENRLSLLKKASKRVKDKNEIRSFIENNEYLYNFCKFMAIKENNGGRIWHEWENENFQEETFFAWEFIQYEFFCQWNNIKQYANSKGIKLIGDVPIYVSLDSADVWSNKKQFLLDKDARPTKVAGVPPDYFSKNGQLWGNPLYNWNEMKKDGYKWWCDRLLHMQSMFDAVRIDHFRGIESFWAIENGEKTAKNGKWMKGPGMSLINALKKTVSKLEIIAEDLGDITEDVKKLVYDSGFPEMRVFQFAFLSDDDNPHLPHNYTDNCVAYSGTHDNNTLLGYLWELENDKRNKMLEYCGHTYDFKSGLDSIIRTIFASHAKLVILPIQDILGFGSDTRLNTPGVADGNWGFRITKEQLDGVDIEKFKRLNSLYRR